MTLGRSELMAHQVFPYGCGMGTSDASVKSVVRQAKLEALSFRCFPCLGTQQLQDLLAKRAITRTESR